MKKRTFLFVTGKDFTAMLFDEMYDRQAFYEEMIKNEEKFKVIDKDGFYARITIVSGIIDDTMLELFYNEFIDYDFMKSTDLFEVESVENE